MELYDVKAPLIRYPLNSKEISHLFRAGYLHRRVRCKPQGETHWKTIGELFPLLEYNSGYSLPTEDSNRGWGRLALPLLAILIAVAAAYICWERSARISANVTAASQSADRQVDTAIVIVRSN
jgi:hypothetical protein